MCLPVTLCIFGDYYTVYPNGHSNSSFCYINHKERARKLQLQLEELQWIRFPMTAAFLKQTTFCHKNPQSSLKIYLILPSVTAKEAAGSSLQGRKTICLQDADEKCSALQTITSDSVHKKNDRRTLWLRLNQTRRCNVDKKLVQLGI